MAFKGSRQASRCHYQHDCTATLPTSFIYKLLLRPGSWSAGCRWGGPPSLTSGSEAQ